MDVRRDESAQVSDTVRSIRAGVLDEARQLTSKDRNSTYGEPEDNFGEIAASWRAYLKGKKIKHLDASDVALMMVLMKVARLKHNPGHRDSWVDAAGYAACGAQCALTPKSTWQDVGYTTDVPSGSVFMAPVGTPEPTQLDKDINTIKGVADSLNRRGR